MQSRGEVDDDLARADLRRRLTALLRAFHDRARGRLVLDEMQNDGARRAGLQREVVHAAIELHRHQVRARPLLAAFRNQQQVHIAENIVDEYRVTDAVLLGGNARNQLAVGKVPAGSRECSRGHRIRRPPLLRRFLNPVDRSDAFVASDHS